MNQQPTNNSVNAQQQKRNFLVTLKKALKGTIFYVFIFSAAINLIMLILPIYSLQVFDRVMSSGSVETLIALTVIAVFLFIMFGIFNGIREVLLIKISGWIDQKMSEKIFKLSINHSSVTGEKLGASFFHDANAVKNFVTSPTIFSIFDIPWSLVFLFVIFLISPLVSMLVAGGALILLILTGIREFRNKPLIKETNEINSENLKRADEYIRYSETVEAMGMLPQTYDIWAKDHEIVIDRNQNTSKFASVLNSIAKSLRMMLQISIIGLGTYLALNKEMTFGGIIACSILAGRTLAPFEALMSIWSNFGTVRDSYERLNGFFSTANERPETITLEKPTGDVELEKVVFVKPGGMMPIPIIKGVDLKIDPGDVIGVIGPSASGKSTLIKLITGIYKPFQGVVKIDGGDAYYRNREDLGRHIGYLPQSIDLFKGTIKENISRFDPDAKDEDIIKAAKITGVHDLVLSFNEGYNTVIGDGIVELSGGQKQRVGLARAFYGDPNIIILDEPNANLDEIGERMLLQAIVTAKKAGKTLIMISHKPTIINITDKIVVVKGGQLMDYGPTKEIMGKYARSSQQGRAAPNKQNIAAATSQPAQPKANTNNAPEQSKKTPAPQKDNNKSVEPKRPTEQGNSKTSQDNKNTDKAKKENKKGKKDN